MREQYRVRVILEKRDVYEHKNTRFKKVMDWRSRPFDSFAKAYMMWQRGDELVRKPVEGSET